jgi:hypothetical protein
VYRKKETLAYPVRKREKPWLILYSSAAGERLPVSIDPPRAAPPPSRRNSQGARQQAIGFRPGSGGDDRRQIRPKTRRKAPTGTVDQEVRVTGLRVIRTPASGGTQETMPFKTRCEDKILA